MAKALEFRPFNILIVSLLLLIIFIIFYLWLGTSSHFANQQSIIAGNSAKTQFTTIVADVIMANPALIETPDVLAQHLRTTLSTTYTINSLACTIDDGTHCTFNIKTTPNANTIATYQKLIVLPTTKLRLVGEVIHE